MREQLDNQIQMLDIERKDFDDRLSERPSARRRMSQEEEESKSPKIMRPKSAIDLKKQSGEQKGPSQDVSADTSKTYTSNSMAKGSIVESRDKSGHDRTKTECSKSVTERISEGKSESESERASEQASQ